MRRFFTNYIVCKNVSSHEYITMNKELHHGTFYEHLFQSMIEFLIYAYKILYESHFSSEKKECPLFLFPDSVCELLIYFRNESPSNCRPKSSKLPLKTENKKVSHHE